MKVTVRNQKMRAKYHAGFTLIEILTVMLLVGIVLGGVSVFFSQDGPDKKLQQTVERFVVISDHISELAILGGEPIGLLMEPPEWRENPLDQGWRYQWQRMRTSPTPGWVDVEEVPPIEIENNIELLVFINDQEWEYENAPEERVPLVAFYPSGEVSPFEIQFRHDDVPGEPQTVIVDTWGRVVWKERAEQEEENRDRFGDDF